jgi:hypothetical protein
MTRITGNTYPVRDQLRALGGRWNAAAKCWEVPDDKAAEANRLVFPLSSGKFPTGRRSPRVCRTCGCKINYGVYCGKCEFGR